MRMTAAAPPDTPAAPPSPTAQPPRAFHLSARFSPLGVLHSRCTKMHGTAWFSPNAIFRSPILTPALLAQAPACPELVKAAQIKPSAPQKPTRRHKSTSSVQNKATCQNDVASLPRRAPTHAKAPQPSAPAQNEPKSRSETQNAARTGANRTHHRPLSSLLATRFSIPAS